MNRRTLLQLGFVVVLLGIAAILAARFFSGPRIDLNPYQALGTIAAEEATRLCGGSGRIVLVVPDPGSDPDPVLEAQLAAFKKSLKRLGRVEIKASEAIVMDPLTRMQTGGAIPPERFAEIRRKHRDAAALVLFLAFLGGADQEPDSDGRAAPKLMVVSAALPNYEALIRGRLIDLAIVPRPVAADDDAKSPASMREAFDREYLILRSGSGDHPGGN